MPKLTIDGQLIEVPAGLTVLQACEIAGAEIPRFCYHERLSVAGNCRMCLVEMEKSPKPIASCAMPVAEGMVIKTDTPLVQKARNGVMEFLLINHPLDCPICDQGGECDLQDQAMAFGYDRSRYREPKRGVTDKDFGPLIKTAMTRCIQCTRCIRFSTEIAGVQMMGAAGRGEHMEVITYVGEAINSELSGNLIDICPVGALLSKPYAFSARPWELVKTESIDVLDAVGSAIRIDSRGREVMRVLPRLNEAVNEEWIADKTRFACDGLKRQRLDRPYLRQGGKLVPVSWTEAFDAIAKRLDGVPGARIAAIAGDLSDLESMYALKGLMGALGSANIDCRQDGAAIDPSTRAGYLFNSGIAGIEQSDLCLLIGTNPRWEAPLINARLRKRHVMGNFKIASIGPATNLTYPVETLGAGPDTLAAIVEGRHPFAERLKAAKKPMLILGQGALTRADGPAILALARQLAENASMVREDWNGFNMLHTAAARVGALDIGFVPGSGGRDVKEIMEGAASGAIDVVYLLGADEIDMNRLGKAFVIYQGHHGDAGAHRADVILPGAAYPEKNATYVNTEGRVQQARLATFAPGDACEDWTILRALSDRLGRKLPFDSLDQLRQQLFKQFPDLAALDGKPTAAWGPFGKAGSVDNAPFRLPIDNFYMTDPISRASATMAACSAAFLNGSEGKTGTHD
ncbi:NADH-quinone oxidoreductase [Hypericibacter terrae]|uniref:NADH-quinone oxidoreductase n=1 Tax=Hypericibacter terrae TaxID=2602015 RepID=A0A5J6MLK4_9PROT|nr:NADH-quinone oxidoreductase subunit NuoG [Hypericibacter terrae]QEX17130.1 NADH-quinone oxidoreductase [Hypericibacter terrae]